MTNGLSAGIEPSGSSLRSLLLERVQPLRGLAGGLVADRRVELAVATEVDRPALMAGRDPAPEGPLVVPLEQDSLAVGPGHVAEGGEPADPVMGVGIGGHVADVDVMRFREVGADGHAQEAALPLAVDLEADERVGQETAVLDHAEGPGLLGHEGAAVGGDLQGGGSSR